MELVCKWLWEKLSSYMEVKLSDGDIATEKLRKMFEANLRNIESKLDSLALKDLQASIHNFNEGFVILRESFHAEPSGHDGAAMVKAGSEFEHAAAFANASTGTSPIGPHQAMGGLKIASEKIFSDAQKCFEHARQKATDAFSNKSLSIEAKILATKLRVASRILQSLDNPAMAVSPCKLFLQELHQLPAVQNIFDIHLTTFVRSFLSSEKRLEMVNSIMMINFTVFSLSAKFASTPPDVLEWPTINLGKREFQPILAPLLRDKDILDAAVQLPSRYLSVDRDDCSGYYPCAVNSKKEFFHYAHDRGHRTQGLKVINSQGEAKWFCTIAGAPPFSSDDECNLSLTIDREDNVYVVTRFEGKYTLFVFDASGNEKHRSSLKFLNSSYRGKMAIGVNKNKDIVILRQLDSRVYVCDNNGRQLNCTDEPFLLDEDQTVVGLDRPLMAISDENEMITAATNNVYIYNEKGHLKQTFNLSRVRKVRGLAFNHITKNVVVISASLVFNNWYLSSYSKTGELRKSLFCGRWQLYPQLISHSNGPVALYESFSKSAIFL